SAFSLAPIGLFFAAVGALMLQTLLLSGAVALGLLAFFLIFFNIFTKLPWDIDSGQGTIEAGTIVDGVKIPPHSLVSGNPMKVKKAYYLKKHSKKRVENDSP
ncbi:hypothetical protein HQ585_15945, partial [candidate division KSB1 bacterium]|nr:hypothetical protein [candidate division KSB1 bacterium]